MNKEEKKAIAQFKEINLEDCSCEKCFYQEIEECCGCPTMIKETLLNLIEKQDKEIENWKKIAEKLARYISITEINEDVICDGISEEICEQRAIADCEQCIIDWARKEVEKNV